jgi:uncharacterized cysteine cluster protein YcgN (CxxCxxCC family)
MKICVPTYKCSSYNTKWITVLQIIKYKSNAVDEVFLNDTCTYYI